MIYAAAGFGGGSSYLAVLALYGLPSAAMRPAALLCNLVVVSGNVLVFRRNGLLDLKKSWPLLAASVPLAFLGGLISMQERTFLLLLGGSLVLAACSLFLQNLWQKMPNEPPPDAKTSPDAPDFQKNDLAKTAALGGGIGFLSGAVGIGGGIFLSPMLNLMRWDWPKKVAATASVFILANSLAGLGGQLAQNRGDLDWAFVLPLLGAVLLGGQIGSRWSAGKLNQEKVRTVTALLTLYAGLNLVFANL